MWKEVECEGEGRLHQQRSVIANRRNGGSGGRGAHKLALTLIAEAGCAPRPVPVCAGFSPRAQRSGHQRSDFTFHTNNDSGLRLVAVAFPKCSMWPPLR